MIIGYVYYSDENYGIHKYHADPAADDADEQLAAFGLDGFGNDREGISIYKVNDGTGYILVSDQENNAFRIFRREGEPGKPHEHRFLKTVPASTLSSDGSDVTNAALGPAFPRGLFVAMSEKRIFHYYAWEDIAGGDLKAVVGGGPAAR